MTRQLAYYYRNRENLIEKMRQRREREPEQRLCRNCDAPFSTARTHKVYCNHKCKVEYLNDLRNQARREAAEEKITEEIMARKQTEKQRRARLSPDELARERVQRDRKWEEHLRDENLMETMAQEAARLHQWVETAPGYRQRMF